MTSGDWLFGIRVENTVRIACVFNAFQREFDKYKNVGGMVIPILFRLKLKRCMPHKSACHPPKCDVINDV